MKAADWIDRVKKVKGWESDYRVAKELGLSRQMVSKYRGPTLTFDNTAAVKVAQALSINPAAVVIDQEAERERAKFPDLSTALQKVAATLYIM